MMRPLAALVLATAIPASLAAQASSPFDADTVLAPSSGPRIVLLAAPGESVAALRLAIPLQEGPAEAGAAWILREMGLERMRTLARPVGAEVAASRTPWGIAYSVVGAAADFEYLAYLLREAVSDPDVTTPFFRESIIRLGEEVSSGLETPAGRIAAEIRDQLAPGVPPVQGTTGSIQGLGAARVREVWLRSHQAGSMTLVVSAPVIPEVVLAATRGMGAPPEAAAGPLDAPAPSAGRRPTPQSLRTWYGEAWQSTSPADPHAPVVALLVANQLRAQGHDFEVGVELWELPGQWILTVVGAGYGRTVSPMRRAVSAALSSTRDALTGATVSAAVAQARRDVLVRSRTPAGLVSVVGRAMEADGEVGAATRSLAALRSVTLESTRSFLDLLLSTAPARAEVRP